MTHRPAQAETRILHPNIFEYVANYYQRTWPQADLEILRDEGRFSDVVEGPMLQRIDNGQIRVPIPHRPVLVYTGSEKSNFRHEWDAFADRLRASVRNSGQPADPIAHVTLVARIASGIAAKDINYQTTPRRGGLGNRVERHASFLRDYAVIPGKSSGSEALNAMQRDLTEVLQLDPSLSDDKLLARVHAIWQATMTPTADGTLSADLSAPRHRLATLRTSLILLASEHDRLKQAWRTAHPGEQYSPDETRSRATRVAGFLLRLVHRNS